MEIIYKKVSDLKPYEKNPRKNDEAVKYVAKSIEEFGFKVPIIIDNDNTIVAGHTRWKAAKKLKIDEVPCIIADDLNETQIKAFRLADNKVSEKAEWDFDLLSNELSEILDLNMADFGFEDLLDQMKELPEDDEFDADTELEKEAFVKKGDIWHLGRHKLMCGDSTTSDVQVLMEGKYADLCVTDAPYNVDYEGGSGMKIQNDNMSGEEFYKFFDGKYILDGERLIICQSNAKKEELKKLYPEAEVNPIGDWTGGSDVDSGATNRKLGSDMADSITGGGLSGKDCSKADVSVNIYAWLKAQKENRVIELSCAIGDEFVDGKPYSEIVKIAKDYIDSLGGFEKFSEWGLV